MSVAEPITISVARSPDDMAATGELFREYAAWLGFSLGFQGLAEELATLPGRYAAPAGRLLLARCAGALAGCGALRVLEPGICEMKRLYVRPEFRGRRLGSMLAEHLIADAKAIGYDFMRLDTLRNRMEDAIRLYRSLGFYEIPAYYSNPQPEVCYLELRLR
jgi:ribosomal protein S18 acetylase RimI-like enzyme